MYFMGEPRKLWRESIPDDPDVYELVFLTGADPDRIRQWSLEDRKWLKLWPVARSAADAELAVRAKRKNNGGADE